MAIFFDFITTSNHLHPLQVENCDSNSRLVVDEDQQGLKRSDSLTMCHVPESTNSLQSWISRLTWSGVDKLHLLYFPFFFHSFFLF